MFEWLMKQAPKTMEQAESIRDEAKGLIARLSVVNRVPEQVQQAYEAMMSQKQ